MLKLLKFKVQICNIREFMFNFGTKKRYNGTFTLLEVLIGSFKMSTKRHFCKDDMLHSDYNTFLNKMIEKKLLNLKKTNR